MCKFWFSRPGGTHDATFLTSSRVLLLLLVILWVVVVQTLSHVQLFVTPWTAVCHAFLSSTISQNFLKFISTESVIPSNHLWSNQDCCSSFLLPSIFPSIRVFSSESVFYIRCPKYWSFISVLPMNIQGWFPLVLTSLISLQSKGLSRVLSSTTVWKHRFFKAQPYLCSNSYIHTWLLEKP